MSIPSKAPFDMAAYGPQFEIIQNGDPHARAVGSFGRMVLCQQAGLDPYTEFILRAEQGLSEKVASPDIDVLGASIEVIELAAKSGEITIDTRAFGSQLVSVDYVFEKNNWYLNSADLLRSESYRIAQEHMKPISGVVDGVEIVTLPLTTQRLLHLLRPFETPKDAIANSLLTQLIEINGGWKLKMNQTQPFAKLQQLIERQKLMNHRYD